MKDIIPTPEETNKLDGFGPLYIINLKRRTDRHERMMNLIYNNNITDYTFIDADVNSSFSDRIEEITGNEYYPMIIIYNGLMVEIYDNDFKNII